MANVCCKKSVHATSNAYARTVKSLSLLFPVPQTSMFIYLRARRVLCLSTKSNQSQNSQKSLKIHMTKLGGKIDSKFYHDLLFKFPGLTNHGYPTTISLLHVSGNSNSAKILFIFRCFLSNVSHHAMLLCGIHVHVSVRGYRQP